MGLFQWQVPSHSYHGVHCLLQASARILGCVYSCQDAGCWYTNFSHGQLHLIAWTSRSTCRLMKMCLRNTKVFSTESTTPASRSAHIEGNSPEIARCESCRKKTHTFTWYTVIWKWVEISYAPCVLGGVGSCRMETCKGSAQLLHGVVRNWHLLLAAFLGVVGRELYAGENWGWVRELHTRRDLGMGERALYWEGRGRELCTGRGLGMGRELSIAVFGGGNFFVVYWPV